MCQGEKREGGQLSRADVHRGFECLTGLYRDSVKEEDAWCRERKGNDGKVISWVDAGCLCAAPFVGTKIKATKGDNHFSLYLTCTGGRNSAIWLVGRIPRRKSI